MPAFIGEAASLSEKGPSEGFEDGLEAVRAIDDPRQQFLNFCKQHIYARYELPTAKNLDDVSLLIGFAADETASKSLLVRAQALEYAINTYAEFSTQERQAGQGLLDSQPLDFLSQFDNEKRRKHTYPGYDLVYNRSRFVSLACRLAEQDGITKEVLFPEWYTHFTEPQGMPDFLPTGALSVLEELAALQGVPHRLFLWNKLPLVPLALGIQKVAGDAGFSINSPNMMALEQDALTFADVQGIDDKNSNYSGKIIALQMASQGLQRIFPERYSKGVRRGAQSLVANSAYALLEHARNDYRTSVGLPLHGGGKLPFSMNGEEPGKILDGLFASIQGLVSLVGEDGLIASRVVVPDDYYLYRLWSQKEPQQATVYVRPSGAHDFDEDTEYGRRHEGVEASVSYVIDPLSIGGQLLKIGRHTRKGIDNRVSIRLDREGVSPGQRGVRGVKRDPTYHEGTLSLDIGSVLGNQKSLGTKIGRFLAWGNMLRNESLGLPVQLNHATQYFGPMDGHADVFASSSEELVEKLESRRATQQQLKKHLLKV